MSQHPFVQCFRQRLCFFLPYWAAIFITHLSRLTLNFVQAANRVQCMFGQLTIIRRVQIEKLAPRMGHAADFDHAFLETGFVASKVIALQFAVPCA